MGNDVNQLELWVAIIAGVCTILLAVSAGAHSVWKGVVRPFFERLTDQQTEVIGAKTDALDTRLGTLEVSVADIKQTAVTKADLVPFDTRLSFLEGRASVEHPFTRAEDPPHAPA